MILPERLTSRIWVNPETGCWEWEGQKNKYGYGMCRWGRMDQTHRIVWRLLRGPIPIGFELDHLCRVRHCCNPIHLEVVTHKENVLRGDSPSAIEARSDTCPNGHPRTTENITRYKGWRVCRVCANERSRKWNVVNRKQRGITRRYQP